MTALPTTLPRDEPGGSHFLRERWRPLLVLVLCLPFAIDATWRAAGWIGTPFPGFLLMGNAVVPTVSGADWPREKERIFHARVRSVDGRAVRSSAEVYDAVAARPAGTPFRYGFAKGGQEFERTLPSVGFSVADFSQVYGILLLVGWLCLGTGVIVGTMQPHTRAARIYLGMSAVGWLFATGAVYLHLPGFPIATRLYLLAESLFPAAFTHFALVFPVDRDLGRNRRAIIAIPYAIGAAIGIASLIGFQSEPPSLVGLHAAYVFNAVSFLGFTTSVLQAYVTNPPGPVRQRIKVLLPSTIVGATFAIIAFVDNAFSGGSIALQLGLLFVPAFFASVAYAIATRDLFDIDRLVRQSFVYGALTVIVVSTYALVLALSGRLGPRFASEGQAVVGMAFVVVLAFLLDPLRRFVQRTVDRAFFRSQPNYRHTIGELSEVLATLLDPRDVVAEVTRVTTEEMQVEATTLSLLADADHPAASWTRRAGRGLEPGGDAAGAALVLPIRFRAREIGTLALGARRSGLAFSRDDAELLRTLANQTAIAVHNARSYQSLAALTRDLDRKVVEQTHALRESNDELSRAYKDLKQAQAQLVQSEKMASLGQLVAGVAHELNNPASFVHGGLANLREWLAGIVGVLRLYERVRVDDPELVEAIAVARAEAHLDYVLRETPELLRICSEGSERIKKIVDDLRLFARADRGERTQVDLHLGIESTLSLLAARVARAGARIEREYGAVPEVEANPGQLNQVWMNLLDNAVDAVEGRSGGEIRITTRAFSRPGSGDPGGEGASQAGRSGDITAGWVEVRIADDGVGVDPAHLERIFEPFFTTKPIGRGTGLGLAIAYGAVKSHEGSIELSLRPGGGTEVTVRLPVGRGETRPADPEPPDANARDADANGTGTRSPGAHHVVDAHDVGLRDSGARDSGTRDSSEHDSGTRTSGAREDDSPDAGGTLRTARA